MTLGERIKQRRKSLGYSQQQVADLAGISQIQISRYELDASQPTSDVIIGLAHALRVSSDWLLGLTGSDSEVAGLNDLERQALTLFRNNPPERQLAVIEILRLA